MAGKQGIMKIVKIFLSDPQILFREGIHFVLSGEEDFEVTGETTNNEEALTYIEANPPQIAILNTEDKKLSGPEIISRLKRRLPSISVILTIEKKDEEQLFEVIKSGASACLTKDTDPEQLLDIVRAVSQGTILIVEELLTPVMATRTLAEFDDIDSLNEGMDNLMAGLTLIETQILNNIAAGNSTEQIAAKLNTDEELIRSNLKLVLNKLVANDQTKDVIATMQRGLPSAISKTGRSDELTEEYLTREEFSRFKESLAKRLKNVIGEVA
jgi:DNA-binding NarL/FixJ family response regulator